MADTPARAAPTLHVASLAIALPAGFERRAARIGRLTAEQLAAHPPAPRSATLPLVQVPPLTLRRGASDQSIAAALAAAIRGRLDGGLP
ncbi:MAG: hypothetical protein KDG55_13315 [Rhodocyclaceae bacterium]|nr:hypothetical protein [Rhodocyclaceae bacterium]